MGRKKSKQTNKQNIVGNLMPRLRYDSNWLRWAKTCSGKCSKISNTFLFLFSNKMLVIRAGIYNVLVRKANREDPDQTASSEAVWSASTLFV